MGSARAGPGGSKTEREVRAGLRGQGLVPGGFPVPGQEFVHTGVRQLGDAGEDIGEPSLRVDVVEFGGDDEGVHRRGALAPAVGAGEQPRPSAQSNPAQRPFRTIIGKADAAIDEEAGEAVPTLEHVVDRLRHRGVARQPGSLGTHPRLEFGHQRCAALAAHRRTSFGGLAVDLALDVEQRIDAFYRLQRQRSDRRRALAVSLAGRDVGEFVEYSPTVGPNKRLR